jgi:hypothetical protein
MLNEIQLKEKLQVFAENEFHLSENDELSEIIPDMLNHIGSTDGYLRDDLIYSAFDTWILEFNAINPELLRGILLEILNEQHMLYNIGEQNTDSVFRRSFSVLLLPLLLGAHLSQPYLTSPEIQQIKEKLLYFVANEKDRRGFVSGKGWAHSIAHAADALDKLALCSELNKIDLAEILEAIHYVICTKDIGYLHGEDERNVTAVITIIKRELLSEIEITQWIQSFAEDMLSVKSLPEKHIIRSNVKSFLQSLYFRLQWEKVTNDFNAPITQALKKINPFIKPEGG